MKAALSERQRRELEFYEEFSKLNEPSKVSFDWISARHTRPWNSYRRLIDIARQNFTSEDQKLLDFGCGKGQFSILFSKIGYEVFGFDLSPKNIEIANRLARKNDLVDKTQLSSRFS